MRVPTLRSSVLVATVLVLFYCATLITFALFSAKHTDAGILTLHINFTHLLQPSDTFGQPAADTRPDAAVSNTLAAVVPHTVSLGTKNLCFEYTTLNRTCIQWPQLVAGVLPPSIEPFWPPGLAGIDAPVPASANTPNLYIQANLLEGLLAVLTQTFVVNGLLRDTARIPLVGFPGQRLLWAAVLFIFGLRCCLPFYKTVVVLGGLRSTTLRLPEWITVQFGPAYGMCLTCLFGSAALTALGTVLV